MYFLYTPLHWNYNEMIAAILNTSKYGQSSNPWTSVFENDAIEVGNHATSVP